MPEPDKKKASARGSATPKGKGQPHPLQSVMNVLMDPLGSLLNAAGQKSGEMQAGPPPLDRIDGGYKDPAEAKKESREMRNLQKNSVDATFMQRELVGRNVTPDDRARLEVAGGSDSSRYSVPTGGGSYYGDADQLTKRGYPLKVDIGDGWTNRIRSNNGELYSAPYGLNPILEGQVGNDARGNSGDTPYDVGSPFLPLDQRSPQQVQNRKWAQEQGDLPTGKPTKPMPRDQQASPPLGDPSLYRKTNSYSTPPRGKQELFNPDGSANYRLPAPDISSILLQKLQHYDRVRAQGATHEQAMGAAASAPHGGQQR